MPKLVYACDYCGQFFTEDTINEHEKICNRNPANRKCQTCRYARLNGGYIQVGDKAIECIGCTYCEELNMSIVRGVDGSGCENYEEGRPMRIVAL